MSDLVVAGRLNRAIQVSLGNPASTLQETLDRPVDKPMDEQSGQPADDEGGRSFGVRGLRYGRRETDGGANRWRSKPMSLY